MHRYHGLFDLDTNILLALGTDASAIFFLNEAISYTYMNANVHRPNYTHEFRIPLNQPEKFTDWTWMRDQRKFVPTNASMITDSLRNRSTLAVKKYDLVRRVLYLIARSRYRVDKGLPHQEHIYAEKKRQAQMLKDAGWNESMAADIPYVIQYAEYTGCSPKQAAEEILFKSKLADELCIKTELIRLVYCNKIKKASTLDELATIGAEFDRDSELNAMLT